MFMRYFPGGGIGHADVPMNGSDNATEDTAASEVNIDDVPDFATNHGIRIPPELEDFSDEEEDLEDRDSEDESDEDPDSDEDGNGAEPEPDDNDNDNLGADDGEGSDIGDSGYATA